MQTNVNTTILADGDKIHIFSSLVGRIFAHKVVQRVDNERMEEMPNPVYRPLKRLGTSILAQNRSFSTRSVKWDAIYRVPIDG